MEVRHSPVTRFGQASAAFVKHLLPERWWRYAIVLTVLALAFVLGGRPSRRWALLLVALPATVVILREPRWGLLALPFIALLVPMEFSTGTAVRLNAVVFAIPGLAIAWLAHGALSRSLRWAPSRLDRPLVAFLVVTFTSLLRGNVMWDPAVPRAGNLLQVQLGQVTIYVLSFACFWLMAHMTQDRDWLRRVPYAFLTAVGFALFVLFFLRGTPVQRAFLPRGGLSNLTWVWAASLSLALALCDGKLKKGQKVTLLIICIAAILWPMRFQRSWLAAWLPLLVVVSVILWLSFPHLRRLMFIGLIVGAIVGTPFFLRAINWESEWETSGGSRLALWRSVIELTAQSPILGLGPAAYRHYHYLKPLTYGVTWLEPNVSAHNQFVDLFAQLGLAGLVCYIWFLVEALILAWQIYRRSKGFNKGYALAVIGALAGTFVADMVAATSLPFVYNVGFRGFRASVLGWMFLGGLVAVEKVYGLGEPTQSETAGTPARSG